MSERTRGTIVRTLDLSEIADVSPAYGYAYATGTDGTEYVICTEGVGWKLTDSDPLVVDYWDRVRMVPIATVRELAARGTDTDLADFVRVFGARLESNFYGWQRRIGGNA